MIEYLSLLSKMHEMSDCFAIFWKIHVFTCVTEIITCINLVFFRGPSKTSPIILRSLAKKPPGYIYLHVSTKRSCQS